MIDIRQIRETPETVKALLALRGPQFGAMVDGVIAADVERRANETRWQQLQADRKRLSKEIGALRAKKEDSSALEEESKKLGSEMESLQAASAAAEEKQRELLLSIPNLPHDNIPRGGDAACNPVLRTWGEPKAPAGAQDHVAIGTRLGLFDAERAAKISGSAFICYTGQGAGLERALINFLLDLHTRDHGYTEMSPPFLVNRASMTGTGQLPKFEADLFGVTDSELFLIPTAEVPVTNFHREEILPAEKLPLKYAAYTPCFRREAGSTGRDTRGLIRMHQFDKVELVKICKPEDSAAELESLTADAERVLQLLGLPYRVIELCGGDLGFSARRTYDIEVWAPGHDGWLEVSSCSNFGDYQARRMALRFKGADGKNHFCHTLNGSGTALARLYVALLENGLQPDGSVHLPEILQPYFGAAKISAR
ncbi:MAG: serine--tRNA ligase [Chthoniobacterales bacterium]|nr:serine--tRNA ligase [Chthoniobacterales bacterium]